MDPVIHWEFNDTRALAKRKWSILVGRVGFEPTITGARDRYFLCPDGILDQAIPTEGWSGPPPLCEEKLGLQINHSTTL